MNQALLSGPLPASLTRLMSRLDGRVPTALTGVTDSMAVYAACGLVAATGRRVCW